jgi:hypothetical protein
LSASDQPIADSAFWLNKASRFADLRQAAHRKSKMPLGASFHPDGWGLIPALRHRIADKWYLDHGTPEIVEDFQSLAGVCAVALGAPNTDFAWTEWVDYLRRTVGAFSPSALQVEKWSREWRPEPDSEIAVRGLVTEPLEVRPDADPQIVTTELGEIDDVCGVSERMCRRLADETLKIELEHSARTNGPVLHPRTEGDADLGKSAEGPVRTLENTGASEITVDRKRLIEPLLDARGWSILDWAREANVDYNTANDYLNGVTKPRRDTRKKLAAAIGMTVAELPI